MEKQNALIVSTNTNMGKSNEERKEVVHSDGGGDEVPPLYSRESKELEEDPEEESYEELEEDPGEESYEEVVEDPEEELYEELEEDPEEESNEELDDDPEEKSNEGLEDDPEGKPNEEPEEELEEQSNGELEEDPEEESSDELGEEPSSEVGPEEEVHGEEPADHPKEKSCTEHCMSLSNQNNTRTEDLLEVCLSKHRDTDKSEYLLAVAPVANNSNDKKRTIHVTAPGLTPLQDSQSRKKHRQDKSPELKAECSSATSDKDECPSQQQEKTGSSGKRRRSSWGLQPERDGKTGEDGKTSKRRKTKWVTDDSQSKMLGPLQLPDFKKAHVDYELNSEFQELKAKILEINQLLQKPELQNQNPVYDHLRTELIDERQCIISMLINKNSTFQPPCDKPSKFCKKLYIPVTEYPGYNFTGRIVGHRGNTIKTMEKETGAKILLRGKGCMTLEKSSSVTEDLHVFIKADRQSSLDAAVAMVEKLLIPIDEGKNSQDRTPQDELPKHNGSFLIKERAHERAQLEDLANMKRALIKKKVCKVCGEKGHRDYACPDQQSTFKTTVSCSICGCNSHLTANCPMKSYSPLSNSIRDTKIKPSTEIDEANLYVGYLPSLMDEHRLEELFCPFGKLTGARVIKDRATSISKGYGFVKFENASDAAVAIAHLNDYVMDGKMLAVRVAGQPSVADSCLKQYHGPTPNVKSQGTKLGPLLPEQASCLRPTMLSSCPGLPQTKAFDWTPSSSSPYRFSVFSSPTALFPGGTDFPGSQFQSCFVTPPSALHLGLTPISWPGGRGTPYYPPLCRK